MWGTTYHFHLGEEMGLGSAQRRAARRFEKMQEEFGMRNHRFFALALLLLVSFAFADQWNIVGGGVEWHNANGKISVYPHTSTGLIRQVQYANFSWNGTPIVVNLSFVFDKPISYGRVDLQQNVTTQVAVPQAGRVNYSTMLDNVSNYTASNASCQIGDAQNLLRYNVTWGSNATVNTIACFNSFSNVSSNYTLQYQVNGTVYVYQNQTAQQWTDISSFFTSHSYGDYRVYTVNNVQFTNPTLYQTRLTYDVPIALKSGKFSIYIHAGSPDEVISGTAPVYLVLDPWYTQGTINLPANTSYYQAYNFNRADLAGVAANPAVNFSINLSSTAGSYLNATTGGNIRVFRSNNLSDEQPFDVDSVVNGVVNYWARCGNVGTDGNCNLTVAIITNKSLSYKNSTGTWRVANGVSTYYMNSNATLDDAAGYANATRTADANVIQNTGNGSMGWALNWTSTTNNKYFTGSTEAHLAKSQGASTVISRVAPASGGSMCYGVASWGGGSDHWRIQQLCTGLVGSHSVGGAYSGDFSSTLGVANYPKWTYFATMINSTDVQTVYVDGSTQTDAVSDGWGTTSGNGYCIGHACSVSWGMVGLVDYITVYNESKSVDFIKFETNATFSLLGEGVPNNAPPAPNLTAPANASNQYRNVNFTWQNVTDADGDNVTYHLCYGTSQPYTCLANTSQNWTVINGLNKTATYSWFVIANDGKANSTNSSTWQFTTYNATANSVTFGSNPMIETGIQSVTATLNISGPAVFTAANATLTYSNGNTDKNTMSLVSGTSSNGVWQASNTVQNVSGLVNVTVTGYTNATPYYEENSSQHQFYLDKTPAAVNLSISNQDFIAPANITFTASVTDDNRTNNATLYIDGVSYGLMSNASAPGTSNNFTLTVQINASGVLQANAIATDQAGHATISSNKSMNVSNYTVTLTRDMADVTETLTFPLNKTFNATLNYTLAFTMQGNATANGTYSFIFPDGNVSAGRLSDGTIANITNGVNLTITPSTASYWVSYLVENVTVNTSTSGTDTRFVNVTMPNYLNGTSQYYKVNFLMPASWTPTSQHIRIRSFRLGSWATVGDGNLQQNEDVASLQLYNFTTSNTSSYKDTVGIWLDLSADHILEFSVQSGAEDVVTPPSGGGGGGGGGTYTSQNSTSTQSSNVPTVEGLAPFLAWLDGAIKSKVLGIPVYFMLLVTVVIFELVLSYIQAARNKISPALAFIQIAVFFVTVITLPSYASALVV
jgi:hypothetical protein